MEIKCKCKIGNEISKEFQIRRGVKQGDVLSPLLFNLVLERIIREININPGGTIYTRRSQVLAFADDLCIIGRKKEDIEEICNSMQQMSQQCGLQINENKTKCMITKRQKLEDETEVNIGDKNFEVKNEMKYLGTMITDNNDITKEIKTRINAGNRCLYSLLNIMKSRDVSRKCKIKLYKTLIRPVVTYGCESWTLTQKSEELINRFERKVMRIIYGPVLDNDLNAWRPRMNHEIKQLNDDQDLVGWVKTQRIRWMGHLWRMPETRAAKRTFINNPEGQRPRGRPRGRWKDNVTSDLKQLKIRNWTALAGNRDRWKAVVKEAKALQGP